VSAVIGSYHLREAAVTRSRAATAWSGLPASVAVGIVIDGPLSLMKNPPTRRLDAMRAYSVAPLLLAQAAADAVEGSAEGSGEGSGAAALDFMTLYETYYGDYIVGGIGALAVLFLVVKLVRFATAVSRYGVGLPRKTRIAIKKQEVQGNFAAAADLLFEGGSFSDAAQLYEKGDDHLRAGEAWEKAGDARAAVTAFKRAGAPALAGDLYLRRGQFSLAAREFETADLNDKAADAWFKAKDYRAAAELFVKLDKPKEAGLAYDRLGDKAKAAEYMEHFFQLQYDMARGDLLQIRDACELAARAAGYLKDGGNAAEAASLYKKCGYRKRAAELYKEVGMLEEAAEIYVAAGKPMQAARLYDSMGDQTRALKFRGEARLARGDKAEAAADFAAAGEHLRAAELFMDIGEQTKAAAAYEKLGDTRMAADLYRSTGDLDAAGKAFESGGDYNQAAELYREAGDTRGELRVSKAGNNWYRVGEIFLQHKRHEDALAAFQRVDPTDARAEDANMMQGDILRQLKRYDLSFAKYRSVLGDARPDKNNVDLLYKMAGTAEEAGSTLQAIQIYQSILGVDYYFRDVGKRVAKLQAQEGSSGAPGVDVMNMAPSEAMHAMEQSRSARNASVPTQHGRYRIESEIARGGMGIVYKAMDTVLERPVAYKILSGNLKENDVAVKYFLREARAAARMAHPNIVTVFDAGEQDGEYYMAMEYVEGQTLKALINRQGAFPEKLVRYIMVHVCRGLAFAHERGLVHRDIKPGNLMLTRDRAVKIMDFGLAKFVESVHGNHTRAIGTPYYMSPEQIVGKELDGRSDIYSLGVSMFECATGQVPFSKGDLSYHHLHTDAPKAKDLNARLSDELSDIIFKCMCKSPADRFRSANELLAAVRD